MLPFGTCLLGFGSSATFPAGAFVEWRGKDKGIPFRHCLMIGNNASDVFILDEPTNNPDIRSVEIITAAIKSYRGTVLLISHDHYFVKEIKINRSVKLFDSDPVIKI